MSRDVSVEALTKSELRILQAVSAIHNPTRATLAHKARMSLVKVSRLVPELEQRGYIRTTERRKTTGGRPAYIYQLHPRVGYFVGISVWIDRCYAILMDSTKSIRYEEEFPLALPTDSAAHARTIIDAVSSFIFRVINEQSGGEKPLALGLALPGMVDSESGIWLTGLQLTGVSRMKIAEMLEVKLSIPVFIEDVARALAFREMQIGHAPGLRHFVLLYAGYGTGAGIVVNRTLYPGVHGLAGEIGHIEHADNKYRCACNNVGCLETILSVPGVLRLFTDRLEEGVRSSLQDFRPGGDSGELTFDDIVAASRRHDRFVLMTLREIGTFLGDSCAMLIKLFNPQRIIVSGPLTVFRHYFSGPVNEIVSHRVLPEMLSEYKTIFAHYEPKQEPFGASLVAMNRFFVTRLRKAIANSP